MSNKINTTKLLKILDVTPPEQNIMLCGKHGIGKSQIITEYFNKKKIKVVTLFLGQMSDPGDLIGLPKFNEQTGLTDFMPPYWFPTDDNPIVLFLDELNRARPEILQVIMDLALNKKLAGKSLPPGSRIISAVNNGDEYELTDLDPALISRFNIYEFCPEVKEWTSWAEKNNIDGRIIRYIKSNPKMLDSTNGTTNDYDNLKKSPDRRGWEKVSNIIKSEQNLKEIDFTIISGIVGADAAADFIASQKIAINVSGEAILNNGKNYFPRLLELSITDSTEVINQIISMLSMVNNGSEEEKAFYAENFTDLVEYLYTNKQFEILAYFVSCYGNSKDVNIKEFIHQNCKTAINTISKFVNEYNIEEY